MQTSFLPLSQWDNKYVRIIDDSGYCFDGWCEYSNTEYNLHEYGRGEEGLIIDDWLFYVSHINKVESIPETEPTLWLGKPQHSMKLFPEPFAMIEKGIKTIELRLNDPKRRRIRPGDIIRFENTEDETEVLRASVDRVSVFDSFAQLYAALPLLKCGYTPDNIDKASPHDMDTIYTLKQQKDWGVVGIWLTLLE